MAEQSPARCSAIDLMNLNWCFLKNEGMRREIRGVDLLQLICLLPHQIYTSSPVCQRSYMRAAIPTLRCLLGDTYAKAKEQPHRVAGPMPQAFAIRSKLQHAFVRQDIQLFLLGIASLREMPVPADPQTPI